MQSFLYIVDDNPDHHFLLYRILKELPSSPRVQFFEDGRSLIWQLTALLDNNQPLPSLIILDLNMPGINGLQLLQQLKGTVQEKPAPFAHLPVIIMSSETSQHKMQKCYQAGANAFIEKPLYLDQMKKTIAAVCDFWIGVNRISENKTA